MAILASYEDSAPKTVTEDTPPIGPGPISGQLTFDVNPTTQP